MPITDITAARDFIYGTLKTAVEASALPATPIRYPDYIGTEVPSDNAWIRATVHHTDEHQATIGSTGQRRYRVYGVLMIQIFTPTGNGQKVADILSGVVKGAFRGVNVGLDSIVFNRVRVTDVGQSGDWLQTNVTADFDYDEIA